MLARMTAAVEQSDLGKWLSAGACSTAALGVTR
jgi:hypothetical protein